MAALSAGRWTLFRFTGRFRNDKPLSPSSFLADIFARKRYAGMPRSTAGMLLYFYRLRFFYADYDARSSHDAAPGRQEVDFAAGP